MRLDLKHAAKRLWAFNALLALWCLLAGGNSSMLASLTDYANVKADPFDGMAYPVSYVPNWLKAGVWTPATKFGDIDSADLVEIPKYDKALLSVTDDKNRSALMARYTYVTPYMGKYLDDERAEFAGSHAAVDIRAAIGTPVRSVANGVVVRTRDDAGGVGKYVVVRHDAVPYNGQSLEMYVSYLHLDSVSVQPGTKIAKGAVLGRVGLTGFTTTPHLHLQFDRASSPFYPYWPYTLAEAKAAGYDFFSAINAGLNRQAAMAYTYGPFDVISQNLQYSAPSVVSVPSTTTVATATATTAPAKTPSSSNSKLLAALASAADDSFGASPVSSAVSPVTVLDSVKEAPSVPDASALSSPVASSEEAKKEETVAAPVQAVSAPTSKASSSVASAADELFSVTLASAPAPVTSLGVSQGAASAGSVSVEVRALDYAGRVTSAAIFGTVKVTLTRDGSALASATLSSDQFRDGRATVAVKYSGKAPNGAKAEGDGLLGSASLSGLADAAASAAPATAAAVAASSKGSARFSDVPKSSVYFESVQALAGMGVVNGVSKTRFSPAGKLTRAEALAVVIRALGISVDPSAKSSMSDVPSGHWVQPYLAKAVELGALNPGRKAFGPNAAVTRAELASLLFAMGKVPASDLGVAKISDVKTSAWYAAFVRSAVEYGVMKAFNGKFRPENSITRGDATVATWNFVKKFRGGVAGTL